MKINALNYANMPYLRIIAWCVAVGWVVSGCRTTSRDSEALYSPEQKARRDTRELLGTSLNGIQARFLILSYDEETTTLTGRIELRNPTDRAVQFPMFAGTFMHLRVSDETGGSIPVGGRVHMLEPFFKLIPLASAGTEEVRFSFNLRDCFDIPHDGDYSLAFIHDRRLLAQRWESDLAQQVEWSKGFLPIRIGARK